MDLTYSDEHRLLVEAARRFLREASPPAVVREVEESDAGFSGKLWTEAAALGWPGITLPEAFGGSGRGLLDLAVLAEELGRSAFTSPLLPSVALAALPLLWAGTDPQQRRWLPALAAGGAVGSMALVESTGGDEWSEPSLRATATDQGWRLDGRKIVVPYGAAADIVLVSAAMDGRGSTLFAVPGRAAGITSRRHESVGGNPLDALSFDGVRVGADDLVGVPGEAGAIVGRALDHATILEVAYAVGLAEQALHLSVEHARHREQFGRPIGSFQAVAHRCTEIRIDVDAARFLALSAAWHLERYGQAPLEVSTAKAYANGAVRRAFTHAHQVHGAIGFSMEYDLQLYSRRAKAFELTYGATARHHERVAAGIGL